MFFGELTEVSHASSAPDAMDVLLDVTGQVKVDDMFHVADIQTTSSHLWRREYN